MLQQCASKVIAAETLMITELALHRGCPSTLNKTTYKILKILCHSLTTKKFLIVV